MMEMKSIVLSDDRVVNVCFANGVAVLANKDTIAMAIKVFEEKTGINLPDNGEVWITENSEKKIGVLFGVEEKNIAKIGCGTSQITEYSQAQLRG